MGEQVKMNPNKNNDIQNAIMNGDNKEKKEQYEVLKLHNSNLYEIKCMRVGNTSYSDRIHVITSKGEIGMREIGIKKIYFIQYDQKSLIDINDCILHFESDFSTYRVLLSDLKSGDIKINAFTGHILNVYITPYNDVFTRLNATILYYIK